MLLESEVEFEVIEPGDTGVDAFFGWFQGKVFVVVAELFGMGSVVEGDKDGVIGDADVPIQSIEQASGQMCGIPIADRLPQALT